MADRQLGDVLGNAETGHQAVHGAAQVVQRNIDAAVTSQRRDQIGPTIEPAPVARDGNSSGRVPRGCAATTARIAASRKTSWSAAVLVIAFGRWMRLPSIPRTSTAVAG
jgi:hypothetical protein